MQATLHQGVAHHQNGQFTEAIACYEGFLSQNPAHGDALNLLALAHHTLGNLPEAEAKALLAIQQAQSSTNPVYGDWYNTFSLILFDQNKTEEALQAAEIGLKHDQHHPDLLQNKGLALLSLAKEQPEQEAKHLTEAHAAFQMALQVDPGFVEAAINVGNTLVALKQYPEAEHAYQHAKNMMPEGHPTHLELIQNWANLYKTTQRPAEAQAIIEEALALAPNHAPLYEILGTLAMERDDKKRAAELYQQALSLDPQLIKAQYNLGTLLADSTQWTSAQHCFEQVLHQDPSHVKAWVGLSGLFQKQNKPKEAISCLKKAYEYSQNNAYRLLEALMLPVVYQNKEDIAEWRQHYESHLIQLLKEAQQKGLPLDNPVYDVSQIYFYLAYHGVQDRPLQEALAQVFLNAPVYQAPSAKPNPSPFQAEGKPVRKLRVGFLSRFLRPTHTIGKLWGPLLQALPAETYDTVLLGVEDEAMKKGHWFKSPQSHQQYVSLPLDDIPTACQRIQAQHLDVLLFCDLGMEPTSYFIAFSRLAPVQCVTWGHPTTSGLPTIDYFLSSECLEVDTPNPQDAYTEKLVRLPNLGTYYQRPVITEVRQRSDLGLSDTHTLYVCAQSLYKLHPDFDEALLGVLAGDPQGQIIMINGEQTAIVAELRKRWQHTIGTQQERIHFLNSMSYQDYLNLMRLADVILDPYPYGGGNTQIEALAFGTPVVVLPTTCLKGRIAASIYNQIILSHPEAKELLSCVTDTPKAYIKKALQLGTQPQERSAFREQLLATNDCLFENPAVLADFDAFFQSAVATAWKEGLYADLP